MARSATYRVGLRRRREGKTDYRKRTRFLISGIPRLVVRTSNAHYFAHIVVPSETGDLTMVSSHSKELSKHFGWKGHGSTAASGYLTGYLCGKRAVKAGIPRAILDTGLSVPHAGSNIFALLKGAVDGGLQVPCGEGCLPEMERIRGEDMAKAVEEDKSIARFRRAGIDLASFPAHFNETLEGIDGGITED
jgi:large subunit ribosomal protein L18